MLASTDVHSGAFSFNSFIATGTDTRTGLYTATLTLPALCSGALSGPDFPLTISYSPLNNADAGFGTGWALAVSRYAGQHLSLHTGESFRITGTGNEPAIEERRLLTFRFLSETLDDIPGWRVIHRSGVTEHLRDVAGDGIFLPVLVTSQEGRRISLDWGQYNGAPFLRSVTDGEGRLLMHAAREGGVMHISLHPAAQKSGITPADAPSVWTLNFSGESGSQLLRSVAMPDMDAAWTFTYETLRGTRCITAVTSPTGAAETVTYGDEGHAFPGGGRPALPRVTRHAVTPGGGQSGMVTRYEYDGGNFLGLGATGISWSDDGLDNLYRAQGDYAYSVTEIREAGDTRIDALRTYNRFHLQTLEQVTRTLTLPAAHDAEKKALTTVTRTETAYHADESLPFKSQVAWYQMPKVITQQCYHGDTPSVVRQTTEESAWDSHGNLIRRRDASGTVTEQEWYAADSDTLDEDGHLLCPKDPQGFTRAMAVRRLFPLAGRDPELTPRDAAQALETRYRYVQMPAAEGGDGDWLAESEVTLSALDDGLAPRLLKTTARRWVNAPSDLTRHGMPLEVTETLAGQSTSGVSAWEYERVTPDGLPSLRTTTRRFSRTAGQPEPAAERVSVSITDSLLAHGEPQSTWPDGIGEPSGDVRVQYVYDTLGRLTEEVVSPDTAFSATRRYAYGVDRVAGGSWTERHRAEDQAISRTWYDGLGRVVRDDRQDVDDPARRYRPVASVTWDGLGRQVATTQTDWEGQEDVALTTRIAYDEWGEQSRVTGPDGTVSVTVSSPVTLTKESWVESADGRVVRGRVRTVSDESGNPVSVTPLSADGATALPGRTLRYDGYGQVTVTTDEQGLETRHAYDAFGRATVTTLPDDTQVITTWAPHSEASLVQSLTVQTNGGEEDDEDGWRAGVRAMKAARGAPAVRTLTLVSQTFDELDRPQSTTAGSLTETRAYERATSRVKTLTRPSGRSLTYGYEPRLTEEPVSVSGAGTVPADFSYNPKTAELTASVALAGTGEETRREYVRDGRGNLKSTTRVDGGHQAVTTLSYSREGLLLKRRTDGGPEEEHRWLQGRPASISAGGLSESYSYDAAGALEKSVRRAGEETVTVSYVYDEQGRESERTVETAAGPVTFSLTWHDDGRVATRTRSEGGAAVLTETFSYDARGRLEIWRGEAADESRLPRTPYGHAMVRQQIAYDALDNVELCRTRFLVDGAEEVNDAWFTCDATDADRLVSLTYSHPLWTLPAGQRVTRHGEEVSEMRFGYDSDGNMTNDECGRHLAYDGQGRLLTVTDAEGELLRYRYDGNGHLAGVWSRDKQEEERREWDGYRLLASRRGEDAIHYLYGEEAVGEEHRRSEVSGVQRLFITDTAGSVAGEQTSGEVRQASYGAYGTRGEGELETVLGFNGEVREEGPGWYLLGNGYRVYNPVLMRFHSPDSESPLGDGGLNRYVYGLGDPVNIHDPSGNVPSWLGWVGIGIGSAIGVALTVATGGGAIALAAGLGVELLATGLAAGAEATKNSNSSASGALSISSLVIGLAGGLVAGGVGMLGKAGLARRLPKSQLLEEFLQSSNAGRRRGKTFLTSSSESSMAGSKEPLEETVSSFVSRASSDDGAYKTQNQIQEWLNNVENYQVLQPKGSSTPPVPKPRAPRKPPRAAPRKQVRVITPEEEAAVSTLRGKIDKIEAGMMKNRKDEVVWEQGERKINGLRQEIDNIRNRNLREPRRSL